MDDIEIYCEGLIYMSVCSSLDKEATEERVRTMRPSGTTHNWKIADEPFRTGAENGCACPDHAGRRHWLFVC